MLPFHEGNVLQKLFVVLQGRRSFPFHLFIYSIFFFLHQHKFMGICFILCIIIT